MVIVLIITEHETISNIVISPLLDCVMHYFGVILPEFVPENCRENYFDDEKGLYKVQKAKILNDMHDKATYHFKIDMETI